jgi:hypothetical protein
VTDESAPYKCDPSKLEILRAPFPPESVSRLPKKYKDKQGNWHSIDLDYIGHADITERLLDADLLWRWAPLGKDDAGMPLFDLDKAGNKVGLWIVLTVQGRSMLGYGSCEPGKQDAVKELIGDALRNAAMRLGAGLDLWKKNGPAQARAAAEAATEPAQAPRREQPAPRAPAPRPAAPAQAPAGNWTKTPQEPDWGNPAPGEADPASVPGDYASAVEDMFAAKAGPESGKLFGIPITEQFSLDEAYAEKLPFGKHKGKTLRQIADNDKDRGYIRWLVESAEEAYAQKQEIPKPVVQAAMIVFHSMEGGAS